MSSTRYVAQTMVPDAIPYEHTSFTYSRCEPDYSGWTAFEVYRLASGWHWTAVDDDGGHRSFAYGPFDTDEEAYANATGEEVES